MKLPTGNITGITHDPLSEAENVKLRAQLRQAGDALAAIVRAVAEERCFEVEGVPGAYYCLECNRGVTSQPHASWCQVPVMRGALAAWKRDDPR